MWRFNVGLIAILILSGCSNTERKDGELVAEQEKACSAVSKFAGDTMKAHQDNILIDAVFENINKDSNTPEETKTLLKNIAIDAYKQPVFTDQTFRERQVADFSNDTHIKCLELMN